TLTQKQIRRLTGYSKGSVSLYVNKMEEQGLVSKKYIEGTHILQYISTSKRVKLDYLSQAQNFDDLQRINAFCDKILNTLREKQTDSSEVLANKEILSHRMADLKYFIEIRISAQGKKRSPIDPSRFPPNILSVDRKFDPETAPIEKLIHETLVETGVLEANNPKMAQINSYFITRGCLTPKFLIQNTQYSPATVYSILRELHEHRFIEKIPSSPAYNMKSVSISFRLYRFHYYQLLLSRMDTFQKIQNSLRDPEETLFRQHGYPQIYTIVDHILERLRSLKTWFKDRDPQIKKLNAFVKP
ncbi:MAG: MarR family transcriptional regulator, partial [Candidatus Heimdallarchaeota archaeon]|nr:MarR family transcriptional regulator [Candidatus Heimdallarchaeota archaeon]